MKAAQHVNVLLYHRRISLFWYHSKGHNSQHICLYVGSRECPFFPPPLAVLRPGHHKLRERVADIYCRQTRHHSLHLSNREHHHDPRLCAMLIDVRFGRFAKLPITQKYKCECHAFAQLNIV